jgi:hypothetical protein
MASAVPLWLLGKELLLSVKMLTPDPTTGVVATGTASVSFFGVLTAGSPFGVQNSVVKVDMSNSDNPYRNKVIVEQGSEMTITEVLQASTSTAIGSTDTNTGLVKNAIEKLVLTGFHYLVTATYSDPGGTPRHTNVGRYQYNGHGEVYSKTGQNTMALALETFTTVSGGVYDTPVTIS